jgi:hypothetical protein
MATVTYKNTNSTVSIGAITADHETTADETGDSNTLTATIAVSATENAFAWVTGSGVPNNAAWDDTDGSNFRTFANVTTIESTLSLVNASSYTVAFSSDLSSITDQASLTWNATTGTGQKTGTPGTGKTWSGVDGTTRIGSVISVIHDGT